MELLIVTGLSGAGKSQAANALEDLGFYCVDNVPPTIIPAFVDMSLSGNGKLQKMALVTDARGGDMFLEINDVLRDFENRGIEFKILFLDSSDEVLIRRYKEHRRKHPLSQNDSLSLSDAVKKERATLEQIRIKSHYIIDTSLISVAQLKQKISAIFYGNINNTLKIHCKSFGFKYGLDSEADLVFDVRCLPNPFYDENLKEKTGQNKDVQSFVLGTGEAREFMKRLLDFIDFATPLYSKEGKSQLVIAFGCTGGKHRSVTFAEKVGGFLKSKNYDCVIEHRDILKR